MDNEISIHQVRIYHAIRSADRWLTNKEIERAAGNVAARTVRAHTMKLFNLGVIDQAEVFPGYRYRASVENRNPAYIKRLEHAAKVFGA